MFRLTATCSTARASTGSLILVTDTQKRSDVEDGTSVEEASTDRKSKGQTMDMSIAYDIGAWVFQLISEFLNHHFHVLMTKTLNESIIMEQVSQNLIAFKVRVSMLSFGNHIIFKNV